jgi:hypothetical protein
MNDIRDTTVAEYKAEAIRRFGADPMKWRFVCPMCGFEASTQDWKDAGAPEGAVAFSCVGRYREGEPRDAFATGKGNGPCNYTTGGLFNLSPVRVALPEGEPLYFFELAEAPDGDPAS